MNSSNSTESISPENAKIISGFIMLITTFLLTIIPALFLRRAARFQVHGSNGQVRQSVTWRNHILSTFNCLAAGIFVSAGLLHVYEDAEKDVLRGLQSMNALTEFPITMFTLLCGVFLLLFIEQFVNYIIETQKKKRTLKHMVNETNLGERNAQPNEYVVEPVVNITELTLSTGHAHDEIIDPHSPMQSIILVTALSIHSIFEGISLGLQHDSADVFKLVLVIMIHKIAIAISMGINLAQTRAKLWFIFTIALIFSLSSPIGAFSGIGISEAFNSAQGLTMGILQALACGTFVYVTFFEILPVEFNRQGAIRSLYAVGLMTGFLGFALFTFLMGHDDDD